MSALSESDILLLLSAGMGDGGISCAGLEQDSDYLLSHVGRTILLQTRPDTVSPDGYFSLRMRVKRLGVCIERTRTGALRHLEWHDGPVEEGVAFPNALVLDGTIFAYTPGLTVTPAELPKPADCLVVVGLLGAVRRQTWFQLKNQPSPERQEMYLTPQLFS